jgi:hypothetical protein
VTLLTAKPEKSVRQNPAAQKAFEFLSDVLGESLALQFRQGLKSEKVPGDGLIKNRLLRLARAVTCRRRTTDSKT